MVRGKRIAAVFAAAALSLAAAFSLALPFPRLVRGQEEVYECVWENGERTYERYATAFSLLAGISPEGRVRLERNGLEGFVATDAVLSSAVKIFERGNLGELLSLETVGITRLGRAAIWRAYHGTVWYDGGRFVWNGEKVAPVDKAVGRKLVLLEGGIANGILKSSGVKELSVRADAELTALSLIGSGVESGEAEAPYSFENGAFYLDTAGGRRLVAALPTVKTLTVSQCSYADRGALLACEAVEEVTVPFAGNSWNAAATDYRGEFAHLFQKGDEYIVPDTLVRIRITGGALFSHAFYRCRGVKEVYACGLPLQNISRTAFVDLAALELLHTPRADVELPGTFARETAPCGCTVFRRDV